MLVASVVVGGEVFGVKVQSTPPFGSLCGARSVVRWAFELWSMFALQRRQAIASAPSDAASVGLYLHV